MARACRELATLRDVDPTAVVRISAAGDDLVMEVRLADGRTATRSMRSTAALRPTLEALLIVPPDDTTVEAVTRPVAKPVPEVIVPEVAEVTTPAKEPPAEVDVELGGGAGGRIAGHGYYSFAPSAFAELTIGRWLFGMLFRWDVIEDKSVPLVNVFEMETVAVGLLIGRRITLGFGSIDLAVSPRLLSETQTFELRKGEESRTATDIRIGALARLVLGRSSFRGIIELDTDLSPTRLRRERRFDSLLPPLPSWSAGLTGGFMWGTR